MPVGQLGQQKKGGAGGPWSPGHPLPDPWWRKSTLGDTSRLPSPLVLCVALGRLLAVSEPLVPQL
jgi:hypothetical protein